MTTDKISSRTRLQTRSVPAAAPPNTPQTTPPEPPTTTLTCAEVVQSLNILPPGVCCTENDPDPWTRDDVVEWFKTAPDTDHVDVCQLLHPYALLCYSRRFGFVSDVLKRHPEILESCLRDIGFGGALAVFGTERCLDALFSTTCQACPSHEVIRFFPFAAALCKSCFELNVISIDSPRVHEVWAGLPATAVSMFTVAKAWLSDADQAIFKQCMPPSAKGSLDAVIFEPALKAAYSLSKAGLRTVRSHYKGEVTQTFIDFMKPVTAAQRDQSQAALTLSRIVAGRRDGFTRYLRNLGLKVPSEAVEPGLAFVYTMGVPFDEEQCVELLPYLQQLLQRHQVPGSPASLPPSPPLTPPSALVHFPFPAVLTSSPSAQPPSPPTPPASPLPPTPLIGTSNYQLAPPTPSARKPKLPSFQPLSPIRVVDHESVIFSDWALPEFLSDFTNSLGLQMQENLENVPELRNYGPSPS